MAIFNSYVSLPEGAQFWVHQISAPSLSPRWHAAWNPLWQPHQPSSPRKLHGTAGSTERISAKEVDDTYML